MNKIAILGAGAAGIGAAHLLHQEGVPAEIFEKCNYIGGHTASFVHKDGWVFDHGPHISFTRNPRIQELFATSVSEQYEQIFARVNNWWKGLWIKHPVQANLYGIPTDLLVRILEEMIRVQFTAPGPIKNYADWLEASFGRTFAQTFPTQYGLKFHTTHPSNMTTDWVGQRLYRPELTEILRGALTPDTEDVHYINEFRYPSCGGYVSYMRPLAKNAVVHLDHEVTQIKIKKKQLNFRNGRTAKFDHLISSLPLSDLIQMIDEAPTDVRQASQRLACSTCIIVNIGIDRPDISQNHWTYFYDQDFCFSRLSFPHMLSPRNAPPGTGSIQAEVYYSKKYKPVDTTPEACIDLVIRDLKRCGLLKRKDRILFRDVLVAPYANIIFDLDRPAAMDTIKKYLGEIQIETCGRYGEWSYAWSDESFVSGEEAARRVLYGRKSQNVGSSLEVRG
jgi:protoporphyrinogen oxidase